MYIKNGGVSLAMYISDHGLAWSVFFIFSSPPSLFSYHNSLMYMMYRHIRVFKRYGEMKSREKPPLFFISLLRSKKVRVLYMMYINEIRPVGWVSGVPKRTSFLYLLSYHVPHRFDEHGDHLCIVHGLLP